MTTAQNILDNIFTVMERLYGEMRLSENGSGNHLKVFGIFAQLGQTLAEADRASFWRWDKRAHKLITAAATGTSEQIVIDDTAGLVGRALADNRPVIVNDPYSHPDFNSDVDKKTGYVTKSVLVLPVSDCRGNVIGAFQAINKLNGEGFNDTEDVRRLSTAAIICGIALESDLFLADSERDKLTELKNRFAFANDCREKYAPLLGQNTVPLSVIICDIDFFKKVNDTYGHNGGDAVLIHVARTLRDEMHRRRGDAYRWGGEEFVLILEGATVADAAAVAEHIRLGIESSVCRFENKDIKITMSFGCTAVNPALSVEENIKTADERLYRAKETGRNRVVSE